MQACTQPRARKYMQSEGSPWITQHCSTHRTVRHVAESSGSGCHECLLCLLPRHDACRTERSVSGCRGRSSQITSRMMTSEVVYASGCRSTTMAAMKCGLFPTKKGTLSTARQDGPRQCLGETPGKEKRARAAERLAHAYPSDDVLIEEQNCLGPHTST